MEFKLAGLWLLELKFDDESFAVSRCFLHKVRFQRKGSKGRPSLDIPEISPS